MSAHLRRGARWGTTLAAAGFALLATGPVFAAGYVSQAGANAAELSIAGNTQGTGVAAATNDGTNETRTGQNDPSIAPLQDEHFVNAGVAAQEATAGSGGTSAACAGLAGPGGSVVRLGDTACLAPGDQLDMSATDLDLSKSLTVDPDSALGPLAQANPALQTVLPSITEPLADAVADTPLGTSALGGTTRSIDAGCTASRSSASGGAHLVDTKLTMNVAGQEVVLANLPANPPPNTEVPVHLEQATDAILGAVRTQLETMLAGPDASSGPLAPLAALPQALQDQVVTAVVDGTRDQVLKPLDQQLVHLVLNKQTRPSANTIRVSALDLEVLPAAKEQIGAALVQLRIGNVVCGPNAAPAAPHRTTHPHRPSDLPTAVSAGVSGPTRAPGDDSHNGVVLAAFSLLLAGGIGLVGLRALQDR